MEKSVTRLQPGDWIDMGYPVYVVEVHDKPDGSVMIRHSCTDDPRAYPGGTSFFDRDETVTLY
jgi:hypothetical protein